MLAHLLGAMLGAALSFTALVVIVAHGVKEG